MEILWIIVVALMIAGSTIGQKRRKEQLQKPPVKMPTVHTVANQRETARPVYKKEEKKPQYRQTVRYETAQNRSSEPLQKGAYQNIESQKETIQKDMAVSAECVPTVSLRSIDDTPSNFMEQVYNNITTGYQCRLSYERDFVSEATDFLNRMLTMPEAGVQNTEYR